MKKQILLILSLGVVVSASAQGIYFKVGAGYALPVATDVVGEKNVHREDYSGNNNIDEYSSEVISGSFGSGTNFLVGGGFMFSENIGVELNVQYTMSKKYETGDVGTYTYDNGTYTDRALTQSFANTLYINPAIVITPGAGSKAPYGRFGVIIGSPKLKTEEEYYYDGDGVYTGSEKWEYSGNAAVGFQGAVGMNWMLTENIDLFTEVNFVSMTYYPGTGTMTESISNGNDNLPSAPVYYKKIEFKKSIDPNKPQDPDQPREMLRQSTAFSSLGIQVGITYSLSGHGEN
jgi:hypothetical protein